MARKGRYRQQRQTTPASDNMPPSASRTFGGILKDRWLIGVGAIVAVAVAVVIVLGVALQPGGSDSTPRVGDASGANSSADGNESQSSTTGSGVPDFTVQTTSWSGGEEFVLSQNLGKPTVLYFVAAWCFTCIPETQALARIHQEMGDQLNILIFDVDTTEDEDDLFRFKERAGGGDHLWAMDEENRVAIAYNVRTLDTTIIIDAEGNEAYRDGVPTGYDTLKAELTALLEGHPVTPVPKVELPGTFYPDIGREHLQPGQTYDRYLSDPPAIGPHDPQPVAWGVYDTPIPKEKLVHNLEHGGLVILYNCPEGCPDLLDRLKPSAQQLIDGGWKVVLAPYPAMQSRLALLAWGYLDAFDEPNIERVGQRIAQFLEADLASRAPEPNVP